MTVREIVAEWLKNNGYDGLIHDQDNCVCFIGDILHPEIPCDGKCFLYCKPAKVLELPQCMECYTRCISRELKVKEYPCKKEAIDDFED